MLPGRTGSARSEHGIVNASNIKLTIFGCVSGFWNDTVHFMSGIVFTLLLLPKVIILQCVHSVWCT